MKIFTFLTIIFFTFGCSFKEPFLEQDKVLQNSLTWTRKGEIYNSLEIKASIFATYLNPLGKAKSNHDEEFVVSVFVDDDFKDKKKAGLNNPDISITLNGFKPISKKELDEDSKYKKLVPFKNEWSHYYLVSFPKSSKKELKLVLESRNYGDAVLKFVK
jgi:hypothetical protein